MSRFRQVREADIGRIQLVESEYYEGFQCPKTTLKSWIARLPENFLVAEEKGKLAGFMFFEYLEKPEPLPFVHELAHSREGKVAYVSEVGAAGGHGGGRSSNCLKGCWQRPRRMDAGA